MTEPLWMRSEDWKRDSLYWRGEVLKGRFAHWCSDWDGLPVDETQEEFMCCHCWSDTPEAMVAQEEVRRKYEQAIAARVSACASAECKGCPSCWPFRGVDL